jgi:hypothetical protein
MLTKASAAEMDVKRIVIADCSKDVLKPEGEDVKFGDASAGDTRCGVRE